MAEVKGDHSIRDNLAVSGESDFTGDVNAPSGVKSPYLEVVDQKDQGSAGGTFTKGDWRTRDLTATPSAVGIGFATSVTLAEAAGEGGQIVLPAGTYYVDVDVPAFGVDSHQARLADVTTFSGTQAATVVLGTSEYCNSGDDAAVTSSKITGLFSLTVPTTLEVQHKAQETQALDGFGRATNFYITNNYYTSLKMWKVRSDNRPQAASFINQTESVDLNGSDEYLSEDPAAGQFFGFANSWTVALWHKPTGLTGWGIKTFFDLVKSGGNQNRIHVRVLGSNLNDPIDVSIYNSAGTIIKTYYYASTVVNDAWNFLVVTWDGTDLKLYQDGSEVTRTSTIFNNSGTMDNTDSKITRVGHSAGAATYEGRMHSMGAWSTALSGDEVASLNNDGTGSAWMNWLANKNSYTSKNNLIHWWRLGLDPSDIGDDYGSLGSDPLNNVDLMEDAVNISTADLVTDYPGL